MEKIEVVDIENRFLNDVEACLIVTEKYRTFRQRGKMTTLGRHLYSLWYDTALGPKDMLLPGPCGKDCFNPRHRVVKGPSSGTTSQRKV